MELATENAHCDVALLAERLNMSLRDVVQLAYQLRERGLVSPLVPNRGGHGLVYPTESGRSLGIKILNKRKRTP